MNYISIRISAGESLDRYSILQIKKALMTDKIKLVNICNELEEFELLIRHLFSNIQIIQLYNDLYNINKEIWILSEKIRENNFQDYYKLDNRGNISELLEIHLKNDIRFQIKKNINNILNSNIIEEKSYKNL